ncbi:MAG: glycosyltransferase family 2 protein [Candidatus Electrothrix sp. AW3_4]|nr:glycosyltransferase family 2 protein [Candidatus Electrothrix gigas]
MNTTPAKIALEADVKCSEAMQENYRHEKIVIGVPVYNEEKHIESALRSIQEQNYNDFLVLISDNASIDRTGEICKKFCDSDRRFIYIRQEKNIGAAMNFNYLLEHSSSKYFMWIGGHDMIHPSFLERHINFLENNPEYVLSYSYTQWIDEEGNYIRVTNGGGYDKYNNLSPWDRYFKFVTAYPNECTPVNQVIRKSASKGFSFSQVSGCDHILLSRLFMRGVWNCYNECLYLRRIFSSRDSSSITRITGNHRDNRNRKYKLFKAWAVDLITLNTTYLMRPVRLIKFSYLFHTNFVLQARANYTIKQVRNSKNKANALYELVLNVAKAPCLIFSKSILKLAVKKILGINDK